MEFGGSPGRARRRACIRPASFLALGLLVMAVAAGCGQAKSGSQPSPGATTRTKATYCGTARTAANVPVKVEIARGHIACGTARAVEAAYAKAIRSGLAPGNGGGGPVKINGWTCQGFATPIVLATGKASKCVRDGTEILAILPPPPSPTAS